MVGSRGWRVRRRDVVGGGRYGLLERWKISAEEATAERNLFCESNEQSKFTYYAMAQKRPVEN